MNILDPNLTDPNSPAARKAAVDDAINSQFAGMLSTRRHCFNLIYGDGTDLKAAQAVLDQFGTTAARRFGMAQALDIAIITAVRLDNPAITDAQLAELLPAPPFDFTVHADGTIALAEKPKPALAPEAAP